MSPLMWLFLAGLVASGALHAYAASVQGRTRAETDKSVQQPTAEVAKRPAEIVGVKHIDTQSPPDSAVRAQFGTPAVLPDGRTIISCTPELLRKEYYSKTKDQFIRTFVGMWVKISGDVQDNRGDGAIYISPGDPLIRLKFDKEWVNPLSTLQRGSIVTVRGQVSRPDFSHINIEKCELL